VLALPMFRSCQSSQPNWQTVKLTLSNQPAIHRLIFVLVRIPTLIITECVLAYIEPAAADIALQYFTQNYTYVAFLDYEMYNPNDPFGRTMVKNFEVASTFITF
jgi:hypothetical protein